MNIGAGKRFGLLPPRPGRPVSRAITAELERLGITRPFLLNVGGLDPRKNTWNLIDAFAGLPERLREAVPARADLRDLALGAAGMCSTMLDGWTRRRRGRDGRGQRRDPPVALPACEAFVFPSSYEGFGLPLLEAMHCGAAVIAGNNSSQIEVVGDAGLLVDVSDCNDIAAKITRLLDDPALSEDARGTRPGTGVWLLLGTLGRPRARGAERTRLRRRYPRDPVRPRPYAQADDRLLLAFAAAQVGDLRLLGVAARRAAADLPDRPVPRLGLRARAGLASAEFMACDYRLFERFAAAKDYHAIVYQMGNSRYHSFMYEMMTPPPGSGDASRLLPGRVSPPLRAKLGRGFAYLREELARWYPEEARPIESAAPTWTDDWDAIARDCARRGWYLNRRVLDASA